MAIPKYANSIRKCQNLHTALRSCYAEEEYFVVDNIQDLNNYLSFMTKYGGFSLNEITQKVNVSHDTITKIRSKRVKESNISTLIEILKFFHLKIIIIPERFCDE